MPRRTAQKTNQESLQRTLHHLRIMSYSAFILGVISLISVVLILYVLTPGISNAIASHQNLPSTVSSSNSSASNANSNFGHTLAGIDTPLNASALAVINDAPNAYFQTAGEAYLNGSLADPIFTTEIHPVKGFVVNNKVSMVYLGSITCVFCGENRWAMALALSRFGHFNKLFLGYSSFGDGDLPTLYWTSENYNGSSDSIGNYYSSNIINFISIEDTHPITGGFVLNPIPTIVSNVYSKDNSTYTNAIKYILNLSSSNVTVFQGTPYTVWGNYQFSGADAEVFGNTTPTGSSLQLTYMTHGQVLSQLANPTDQFAQAEYAAADVYIAAICKSINNNATVCSLPAIASIEYTLK
jgi:hypothetical protein